MLIKCDGSRPTYISFLGIPEMNTERFTGLSLKLLENEQEYMQDMCLITEM